MKFINYLEKITNVGIFPLISLMIFFLFFAALLAWVLRVNKTYITKMSELPLSDNQEQP